MSHNDPTPAAVQAVWEANAAFWDDYVGAEGNAFHRILIAPATLRLLALRPDEEVLEIACGNGQFAREMARLGARVTAFDFAPTFIERARAHSAEANLSINYYVLDATQAEALSGLGVGRFDAAVANMAFMDIIDLPAALRATTRLLKPGGRLVFSIMHPCFNHSGQRMFMEQEDRDGQIVTLAGVKIVSYRTTGVQRGLGIIGQPTPQYYFNRVLSDYVNACVAAGLLVSGMAEPGFPADTPPGRRPLSWNNLPEIPPALIVCCHKPADAMSGPPTDESDV